MFWAVLDFPLWKGVDKRIKKPALEDESGKKRKALEIAKRDDSSLLERGPIIRVIAVPNAKYN